MLKNESGNKYERSDMHCVGFGISFCGTPSLPPISVLAHTPVPVCAHPDVPKELHFGKEQGKRYADEEMN